MYVTVSLRLVHIKVENVTLKGTLVFYDPTPSHKTFSNSRSSLSDFIFPKRDG